MAWAGRTAVTCVGIIIAGNFSGMHNLIASHGKFTPQISALAVIPLENLSHNPEEEYFADRMTDALIIILAKMGSARITSRTSIMRYKGMKKSVKEIGHEPQVDAVVEGTVMRSGDHVRITAQLIQVSTDMHLWAEAYERDLSEIVALQDEVATNIARHTNVVTKPLEKARVVNPQAYGLYLKGSYFFYEYTSHGWQQAIEYFNKAIESDPGFAPA